MDGPVVRPRRSGIRWSLLAVVAVILAIVAFLWYASYRGQENERKRKTKQALVWFQMYATGYLIIHDSLPGPTLRKALDAFDAEGWKYYESSDGVRLTAPGFDAWGHELVYEILDARHAIIRSVGGNGVDERGAGDDIEMEISVPVVPGREWKQIP